MDYFLIALIVVFYVILFIWIIYLLINENTKLQIEILAKEEIISKSESKYENITNDLLSHIDLTKFKKNDKYPISCKCPSLYGAVNHGSETEHKKICPLFKKLNSHALDILNL